VRSRKHINASLKVLQAEILFMPRDRTSFYCAFEEKTEPLLPEVVHEGKRDALDRPREVVNRAGNQG
jgi:hypothetical protein